MKQANKKNVITYDDLIRVCKKRKYKTYSDAYAHTSVGDIPLKVYYCDICESYHLSKKESS